MKTINTQKKTKKSSESCCKEDPSLDHPDHSDFVPRLKRIEGQISGIQKMINEGRYCVDILVQFRAAMAALRSVEVNIFERHLQHCLSTALHSKDKSQVDAKIQELTELLNRRNSI